MIPRIVIALAMFFAMPAYGAHRILLSERGAILYYNAPAAITVEQFIYASWISGQAEVTLAKVANGKVVKQSIVHRYESQDDHAAPAVAIFHEHLLLATAKHSSDLFVYRVDKSSLDAEPLCHSSGSYSYPRWLWFKQKLFLFVRTDGNGSGDLSVIEVSEDGCSSPKPLLSAEKGEWLYVTVPSEFNDRIWFAWSVYSQRQSRHEGVYVAAFDKNFGQTKYTIQGKNDHGPELLAWSISKNVIEYVEFSGPMECCGLGTQRMISTDLTSQISQTTSERRMPLYPSWSKVPTECGNGGLPFQSQPILGMRGGLIGSEILSSRHSTKNFDSSVFLCIN